MSNLVIANDSNFEQEVINSDIPVIVDFWAEWCAPCRLIAPLVEDIGNEYAGKLKVCKFDVDSNPQTSMKYGIRSIPTLLIFKGGQPVETIIGAVPKEMILNKLQPFL
jgi:thioredoxin 1